MPKAPLTFDVELAPRLLQEFFEEPEVERWDAPLIELPTARAVRDYLVGKQVAPTGHEPLRRRRSYRYIGNEARRPAFRPQGQLIVPSRRTSLGPEVTLLPDSRLERGVAAQNTDARARESLPS